MPDRPFAADKPATPEAEQRSERDVDEFVQRCSALPAKLRDLDEQQGCEALLAVLREVPGSPVAAASRAVVLATIAELGAQAARQLASGVRDRTQVSDRHPHVEEALTVIGRRGAEPGLRLGQVADAVGVSRWHLSRLLRARTGSTFLQLLAAVRIERAKSLLLAGEPLSVKEVAARCGYDHVSHFDRQFRRLTGLTPGRFRTLSRRLTRRTRGWMLQMRTP